MITQPENKTTRVKKVYDTKDIVNALLKVDANPRNAAQLKHFAVSMYDGNIDSTLRRCFDFMILEFRYIEDGVNFQNIKTPSRLYRDKTGDCKSFTIFITSFLQCLGVEYLINFVAFNGDVNVTHVYPSAIIDGEEIPLDVVLTLQHGKINQFGKHPKNITKTEKYRRYAQ